MYMSTEVPVVGTVIGESLIKVITPPPLLMYMASLNIDLVLLVCTVELLTNILVDTEGTLHA